MAHAPDDWIGGIPTPCVTSCRCRSGACRHSWRCGRGRSRPRWTSRRCKGRRLRMIADKYNTGRKRGDGGVQGRLVLPVTAVV